MRFNNPGGPIVYPLVDIDGDACDIENCSTIDPIVSSHIRNDNDDAEELSDGSVFLFNDNLKIVDNPGSGSTTTTVSFSVTHNSDDIEERLRDGRVQPNGGADYEMMDDNWSYNKNDEQLIGARFRNINIPANATIISAKIVLTISDEEMGSNRENASVFIDIRGEKAANTTTFITSNYNLSSRLKTASKVDWDIVANSPSQNNTIETPDLMTIVTEILAQGWVTGNAMTFYFQSDPYATNTNIDGDPSSDGNGMRRVYTRNSSSTKQPRLEITYVIGTALADVSQTIGLHFTDVNVPQGATITDAFLDFTVQTVTSGVASFDIVAEKALNSAAFDSSNFSLSNRINTPAKKTIATVNWSSVTNWDDAGAWADGATWDEAGVIKQSPDIKTIIQELVNQTDWCGGNAVSLFLTGSGQRIAVSHDLSASDAPKLRVSYDPDSVPTGGGNQGCINTIINKPVTAGNDDAEEKGNGGINRGSSDLDFRSYNNDITKHSGLRFVDLKIPQGAEILEARLELNLRDNNNPGTVTMAIKAENVGNSDEFHSWSNDISNRATTGSSVSWTIPDAEDGETLLSPDISSLIQSVVNRGDWATDNALSLIISYSSGSGNKEITTYNSDPINAPRLIIKTRWQGNNAEPLITNRSKMLQVVDDLSASGYTPIVSVLDEARRYFEGLPVLHGSYRGLDPAYTEGSSTQNANNSYGTKYRVSHPASYTSGTVNRSTGCTDQSLSSSSCKSETVAGGVYKSPMHENYPTADAKSCQRNFIILLTDGQANAKNSTTTANIAALSGNNYSVGSCSTSSPSNSNGKKCGPELTKYMYENDLDSSISNKQNVITYTIGFAFSSDWIKKVATNGGGSFFEASGDTSQLTGIFESILREIISVDTTFVSPGATVNQFNRLFHRNEVYFSLFKPGEHAQWDGNLKKYLLEIVDPYDPSDPDHPTNGVAQIVGQHSSHTDDVTTDNAEAAVNSSTGFFEEDAQSYWSLAVDGSEVSKGGAAEQIPNSRPNGAATDSALHLYTDIGGSNDIDLVKIHEDNSSTITKELLDIATESDANHTNLLRWIRGVDVSSGTDDLRDWMGDPLHSHPGLVTYGGTDTAPILRLFVGSNDGFLHIIDASNNTTNPLGMGTGKEIFAFMPQELLKNQNTYYQNTLGMHPYGVDGAISFWLNDNNNDSTISTTDSDHVYAYFGLRRGGKSYYALDVSGCDANPCTTEPSVKWKITNGDGTGTLYSATASVGTVIDQFKELSQSWSKMEYAKIKINSVVKNVLIFGGGYDPSNDTSTVKVADATGRAIYIVDADTGQRLWVTGSSASADAADGLNLTSSDMIYSIPSDIRVIDTTGDGLADQFYVGDMGAQVWRFDINNESSSWNTAITGGVIADFGAATAASTTDNRRFFYPVDVALTNIEKTDVLTLTIGSGWRSHPLDSVVDDRLFVLKTTDVYSAPKDVDNNIVYIKKTISDLLDVTDPTNVPDGIRDEGNNDTEFQAELDKKAKMDFTGWYIQMETDGEKIISTSTTFNNHILFSSYTPTAAGNICQAAQGSGRLYIVDLETGKAKLDLNDNDTLEAKTDRYIQLSHGGIPPSPSILIPPGESPPIVLVGTENPLDRKHLEGDKPGSGGGLAPANGVSSTYWREAGEYWDSGSSDPDRADLQDQ